MKSDSLCKSMKNVFRDDPGFPLTVKIQTPQVVTGTHRHEFCECVFVSAGRGMHQSENNPPVPIRRGDVIVIPQGGSHAYTEAEDLEVINLLFDTVRLPPVLLELYSTRVYKKIFHGRSMTEKQNDFPMTHLPDEVFNELETLLKLLADSNVHCYKLGIFMAVLSRLCGAWQSGGGEEEFVPLDIWKLTDYMQQHFQREIYLGELALLAAMSPATLNRHFKAAMGVPPMVYLRNLRLKHAAELLLKTDIALPDIAELSGFSQMPYFFHAFKACYGVSPLEYRKSR